jgi:hypothetical protein
MGEDHHELGLPAPPMHEEGFGRPHPRLERVDAPRSTSRGRTTGVTVGGTGASRSGGGTPISAKDGSIHDQCQRPATVS